RAVTVARQVHRQYLTEARQQRQLRRPVTAAAGPAVDRDDQYVTAAATGYSQTISVYFQRFKLHGHSPSVTCHQEKVVICYWLAKLSMTVKKREAAVSRSGRRSTDCHP